MLEALNPLTEPEVWTEAPTEAETQLDPPYRILLHNDDVTPIEFVIAVLHTVFYFSMLDSERITLEAHYKGIAYVTTLPLEEAKYRVGKAHGMARAAGYPLTFTIEPE
jgi:ATP-dependent Clp protease adaptor protein ClpS